MLFQLVVDGFLIGAPITYFYYKKKNLQDALGLSIKDTWTFVKQALFLLIILILVSFFISSLFSFFGLNDLINVAEKVKLIQEQGFLVIIYLLLVRATSEEIFFRGFLVKRIGWFPASIIFASAHLMYFSMTEFIGAFVLGAILSLAYLKNDSLLPNIFAHIIYNAISLVFLLG